MNSTAIDRLNAALDGRYRIERQLGEGGMATVYLADDLRHERKVALKVLKPELAAVVGADRFLAEIKTTANLQHPHILPLFDSGEADSFLFYVMPYIDGETLRERLDREKQLPVDEGVRIAQAVANALHTAHQAGIVHRDIKPGNILMSRGEPLVADFGIALAVGTAGGSRLTETGLSVGTPYYMSPEQATGDQVIGPASDTYALACVLYEMLVGDPPYQGSTAQAVLGKIIQGSPVAPTSIRPSIPRHVDAAIRKALEKLPADRFTDAHDFAKALADPSFHHGAEGGVAGTKGGGRWGRLGPLAAGAAAVFALIAVWGWTRPGTEASVVRYRLDFPEEQRPADVSFASTFTIADGSDAIVFAGPAPDSPLMLWVKRRAAVDAEPLPGTDWGLAPAVSPDGTSVAFITANGYQLRLAPLIGGAPITLADSVFRASVSWLGDDELLFADRAFNVRRIAASGGASEIVVSSEDGDAFHPEPLPDKRGLIYARCTEGCPEAPELFVHDFRSGEDRPLVAGALRGWYVESGHLVYVRPDGAVFAAPFDLRELELSGAAFPVLERVKADGRYPDLHVTSDGTVLLREGSGSGSGPGQEMVWVSRDGTARPIDPDWPIQNARNRGWTLSPDGTRLAIALSSDEGDDIWVKELDDGPALRLTYHPAEDARPYWSPDGTYVYFLSRRRDQINDLWVRRADGADDARPVIQDERGLWELTWSPDGKWLVARAGGTSGQQGSRNIIAYRLDQDTAVVELLTSEYDAVSPMLSPDGRWLAYASEESGTWEIYVRPFPDVTSGRTVVSRGGGVSPMWSHTGDEIFYIGGNPRVEMMAARVESGTSFRVVDRTRLFTMPQGVTWSEVSTSYDITPDDREFIMNRRRGAGGGDGGAPIVVIENWLQEIEARGGR